MRPSGRRIRHGPQLRKLKRLFSKYIKENVMITTSVKYQPEALVCAISAMGADRSLFAADYPRVSPKEAVELIERTPINNSDKEKIYHLNADRWLNCKSLKQIRTPPKHRPFLPLLTAGPIGQVYCERGPRAL
jgi:hypothetical protein